MTITSQLPLHDKVVVPPRSTRLWFWVFGRRLEPLYRPWVAAQVTQPGYARRRVTGSAVLQLGLVVIPQLALHSNGYSRLFFGALAVFWIVLPLVRRPLRPAEVARLLAYYGVTADGQIRTPTSALSLTPFGRDGFVLLIAQILLVATGGAVVFDHLEARSHCHSASQQALARLDGLLGQPSPVQGFNPDPSVPAGAHLIRAKQVDLEFGGITYLAAYARVPGRRDVGPGVWRVIAPGGVFPVHEITVSSENDAARAMTPSLGFSVDGFRDFNAERALDCVNG